MEISRFASSFHFSFQAKHLFPLSQYDNNASKNASFGRLFPKRRALMSKNIVDIQSVGMKYQSINGEIPAIENISFSVEKGSFVSLVGPDLQG